MIELKSEREINIIQENGRIVAQALRFLGGKIRSGMKTRDLDTLAEKFIKKHDAIPAFKGYRGFPSNICVSVNNEVVHGIPGDRILTEGDLVSIDLGVLKDGYYADGAFTFPLGEVENETQRLIQITQNALDQGIQNAVAGKNLSDISHAIQSYVERSGFSVVRELVGHGIGKHMHEEPQVPNFGRPGEGPLLKEGMVLAIEPMVNSGSFEIKTLEDEWTVVTSDGSLSAHFEHTIAITENGAMILTT
ncbi:MAG: type I methionyl aminopeptidase [Candidatus Zixiibacteriota bacterium]